MFCIAKRLLIVFVLLCSKYANSQIHEESEGLGMSTQDPGYTYAINSRDIVNGVPYYFLENDSLIVNFGSVPANNNQIGARYKGGLMDIILKKTMRDNIDWTLFLLSSNLSFDINDQAKYLVTDSIRLNYLDTSINVFGYAKYNPSLKLTITYKLLKNLPIVKIKLKIRNTSSVITDGYLGYYIDVEEPNQENTLVPGVGVNTLQVDNGWTSNYLYTGLMGNSTSTFPNHGIAWVKNSPNKLFSSSSYSGITYNYKILPNESVSYEFYHITDVASKNHPNGANNSIAKWLVEIYKSDKDIRNDYNQIIGSVERNSGLILKKAIVRLLDNNNKVILETYSNDEGKYSFLLPKSYSNNWVKISVQKILYSDVQKKIFIHPDTDFYQVDFTKPERLALVPITVDASFTKKVECTGLIGTKDNDLVVANNVFVASFSVPKSFPSIAKSAGNINDFYYLYYPIDMLDWIKPSKISYDFDTLDNWWAKNNYILDTMYIKEMSNNRVVIRTESRVGRLFGSNDSRGLNEEFVEIDSIGLIVKRNFKIVNDYLIEKDNVNIVVTTKLINNSNEDIFVNIGDIIKSGGGNERSYIPGVGEIRNDFGRSSDFIKKPSQPWMAQYGKTDLSYGIIYEQMPDYTYAVRRWTSSLFRLKVSQNDTATLKRYIAYSFSLNNGLIKQLGIEKRYLDLMLKSTNIDLKLEYPKQTLNINDTLKIKAIFINRSKLPIELTAMVRNTWMLSNSYLNPINFVIPKNDSVIKYFNYKIKAGGKFDVDMEYMPTGGFLLQKKIRVNVAGPGWYAGDCHTHSVFSDGGGTIEENLIFAKERGLSFMGASDHNTINHFPEVMRLNSKYKDFIILGAEEITGSLGHLLAYNVSKVVPWNFSIYTHQNLIDSVNAQSNKFGKAFSYIAHPNDPRMKWTNLNVAGMTGLEVWNSMNTSFNFLDQESQQTFAQWDSLNRIGRHLFGSSSSDAHNSANVGANYIVAFLDSLSTSEIIYALRDKGCYYGTNGPALNFSINKKMMGSDVEVSPSSPLVTINIYANSNSNENIDKVRLIKNGYVINTWEPNKKEFNIKLPIISNDKDFFRIEVSCSNRFAYSNPIWIKFSQNTIDVNRTINIDSKDDPDLDKGTKQNLDNKDKTKNNLNVYINPVRQFIQIVGFNENEHLKYQVTDLRGKLKLEGYTSSQDSRIDVRSLENDIYILKIYSNTDSFYFHKLIVVSND